MESTCQSCGASLSGKYCSNCGEKKFEPQDLKLTHFFSSVLDLMFFVDNKIVRTYKLLLLKPGFLTRAFIEGRRILYMKPLQLFFLSCLIYFIFLVQGDIFYTSMKYGIDNKPLNGLIDYRALTEKKAQQKNITLEETIKEYDREASQWAKALFFLFIPAVSLVSFAILFWKNGFFVAHLTFVTHWLCFLLLLMLVWLYFSAFVLNIQTGEQLFIPIRIGSAVYLSFAAHKAFQTNVLISILYSLLLLLSFVFLTQGYHWVVALITFYFM